MSTPEQTVGVSVFTDHLLESLSLSRSQLSLAYMIGTGFSALLLTFAGIFYDKYGARLIAIIASIGLSSILFSLSKVDNIVSYFVSSPNQNSFVISLITITLLFFMLRFFGQGILTMVSRNMVMKWFDKRRGFANGFLGFFTAFGFSYAPKFFNNLIEDSSWKGAWITLAITIGCFFTLFVIVFYRDNPEDYGIKPDGKIYKPKNVDLKTSPKKEYTLLEAIKTYSFWIFNLSLMLYALYGTAYTFHVVSIFENAGYEKSIAVNIFLPAAVIAVIFELTSSWLSDYTKLRYFLTIYLFGIILSSVSMVLLENSKMAYYFFILGNGIVTGIFGTLAAVTWPRFFGTKHLGAISGFSMTWIVGGSAVGPFLFSLSYDNSGNYSFAGLFCTGIAAVLFILSF